jgi:predicted CXXCH cytochrome family protein
MRWSNVQPFPRTGDDLGDLGLRIGRVMPAASLLAGAALWLFIAVIPALADGGPHVAATNSGLGGLNADSCAGCHRAHTAQGPLLLATATADALCLTCHGSAGVGASTDVESGIQYKVALPAGSSGQDASSGTAVLGALRGGGFVTARIDSSNPARVLRSQTDYIYQLAKVGVLAAGRPVTSAHLNTASNGLSAPQVAWGNAAPNTGAGPTVTLGCTTCHNPHGNGQYRILNPIPSPTATIGTFTPIASPGAKVTDAALPPVGDARNYTVIQAPGGTLLASAAATAAGSADATAGDYWHVRVPWNSAGYGTADAPNGLSASFDTQITAWCSSCHVQHYSTFDYLPNPSGDTLYNYRHVTTGMLACTTCHVAHGSNARMEGQYSSTQPFPNGSAPLYPIGSAATGDSRLLKVDNRGTCQLCHDPTQSVSTAGGGTYAGPDPTPGVP